MWEIDDLDHDLSEVCHYSMHALRKAIRSHFQFFSKFIFQVRTLRKFSHSLPEIRTTIAFMLTVNLNGLYILGKGGM